MEEKSRATNFQRNYQRSEKYEWWNQVVGTGIGDSGGMDQAQTRRGVRCICNGCSHTSTDIHGCIFLICSAISDEGTWLPLDLLHHVHNTFYRTSPAWQIFHIVYTRLYPRQNPHLVDSLRLPFLVHLHLHLHLSTVMHKHCFTPPCKVPGPVGG
jgi:hypothetical protein